MTFFQFNQFNNLYSSADPSGVERVGENENANYPIPTTKYQYQLPDTQYPNTLMPNTENIKMPKYLMIQNIKIPGCGRGPVALADGSNILGHCLGRSAYMPLPYHTIPYGIKRH